MARAQPDTASPIGRIYTMDEAAAHLRMSRRAFQELIKTHPAYAQIGRRKLFNDANLSALWSAMQCPLNLSAGPAPTTGISGAPSEASLSMRAHVLTTKGRRSKSASRGKARS